MSKEVKKRAVVNVASGQWYPIGQDRLANSVRKFAPGAQLVLWKDDYPPGSPKHDEVPYGFKTFAIKEAIARGHTTILWMDASMFAIKPLAPLFQEIETRGVCVWCQGDALGTWCSDAHLETLGITREESFKISLVAGGIVGLDMRKDNAKELLERWHGFATDGISFKGSWTNRKNEVSDHPKVQGHRHDMPSLSYIVKDLGIEFLLGPNHFAYWRKSGPQDPKTCIVARGM